MSHHADRVQETTASVGTGAVTLGGAVSGFRAFSASFANNDAVRYCITGGAEWEVGEGTYSTGVLSRNGIVYSSSNAGALVNFSSGTKAVFCALPAIAIADLGVTLAIRSNLVPQ